MSKNQLPVHTGHSLSEVVLNMIQSIAVSLNDTYNLR